MSYIVKESFFDVQEGIAYDKGATFPVEGKKASKKRLAELSGKDNAVGRPLIEAKETKKNPEK